ncbi:DUF4442 domain-containing protein [Leptospira biflexa]|uniref:YiiD C-terminal domain-containing protein n=1 Tax=Leptospira biflexa TaxID=172 RepID=UPI0010837C97|nr:YiiD C-terminal domain-containing protein [Leptospira biflexa]TGM32172.1 DUF4442 domain-containing protein [Leptospira biflexa]TGM42150.1 DUF4442 domain-containing protein [Leptospira biflexa]TGM42672.1 DUF4442 domain-containing protein [Leptospira biflexa]TGM45750.1 DUF4442 domain-containing protein [Leptospira biflexa]TGM51842.1 DUF4442 domain-containing protein [Leptospira biflexa]
MRNREILLAYQVNPLWKFLEETYGFEEAFRMFKPYEGANILPKLIDQNTMVVSMPLIVSNTNYVGTHFGGSLYSMCDPFFMFLLMNNLGKDYMVWDKGAKIDFVKPGEGTVTATFHLPDSEFTDIKTILQKEKKTIRTYEVEVVGEDRKTVAKISKDLYIRRLR